MLTIKSDDVYGRSKAYESIIKRTDIEGPKVPESFNVLVKELQGLTLRVDLVDTHAGKLVDAEDVLEANIKDEAAHTAEVEVPVELNDINAVTEASVANEFSVIEDEDIEVDSVAIEGELDKDVPIEEIEGEEA
jgi:DNA-directed RNA polymerase subunit beta